MRRSREVYRKKSNENWNAGEICLKKSLLNSAGNRLYYSLYHAVIFWADPRYCDCRNPPEHERVEGILRNRYTEDPEAFQTFADLKIIRVKADYKLFHVVEEDFTEHSLLEKVQILRASLLKT